MRHQIQFTINDNNLNIFLNLHPTDCTQWVLVIWREGGEQAPLVAFGQMEKRVQSPVYYFESFGVETPPLFLEEYVDRGSD